MSSIFQPKRITVPGFLSDDGLAASLGSVVDSTQAALLNSASPAALGLSDKLAALGQGPVTTVKPPASGSPVPGVVPSPDNTPTPNPADQQSTAIGNAISGAVGGVGTALTKSLFGQSGLDGITQFGTLMPDQQQVAQQGLIDEANQQQQTAVEDAEFRASQAAHNQEAWGQEGADAPGAPRSMFASSRATTDQAAESAAATAAVTTANTVKPTQQWWLNAAQVGARSAAQMGTGALRYPMDFWDMIANGEAPSTVTNGLNGIDKALNTMLPGDKAQSKTFLTQVAAGTGSMAGFMLAGWAGEALGLPAGAIGGVLGAATTGDQQYQEAVDFQATGFQKYLSLLEGAAVGATEAIPLDRMFMRADVGTGGLVHRMLNNTTATGMEEFIQNFGQQAGQDMVAKYGAGYDPNRQLDPESWFEAGAVGALSGGFAGGLESALSPEVHGEHPKTPEAMTQAATAEMDASQANFDSIMQSEGEPPPAKAKAPVLPATEGAPATAPRTTDTGAAAPAAGAEAAPADTGNGGDVFAGDAVTQVVEDQTAYHGTKHKFNRFSTDAIGTGEGAQAYGHGLYFSSKKEIAQWYRDSLAGRPETQVQLDGEELTSSRSLKDDVPGGFLQSAEVRTAIRQGDETRFQAAATNDVVALRHRADVYTKRAEDLEGPNNSKVIASTLSAADLHARAGIYTKEADRIEAFAKRITFKRGPQRGMLATVEVPEDEQLLDYDKPLSQQPTGVQTALDDLVNGTGKALDTSKTGGGVFDGNPDMQRYINQNWDQLTGGWLRGAIGDELRGLIEDGTSGDVMASRTLADYGIPGHKYIGHESGATNYVIYDDSAVQIANIEFAQGQAQGQFVNPETIAAVEPEPHELAPLPSIEPGLSGPIPMVVKTAKMYAAHVGIPLRRQRDYVSVDKGRAARIAEAYQAMQHQPTDPAVQSAYRAMADETIAQYKYVAASGLKIEALKPDQPNPYAAGPRAVLADIAAGHIWFFPTEQGFGTENQFDASDSPLLEKTGIKSDDGHDMLVNDMFRVVHDFFGHGMEGSGFGPRGEENAWQAHLRLFSESARPAMTSETRGQNSWVNYGPHGEHNQANPRETVFADQKTGLMPSWTWQDGVENSQADVISAPIEGAPADVFRAAIMAAQAASSYGAVVHVYTPAEYGRMRLFLSPDQMSGFALDGSNIVSVFSNNNGPRGRLRSIIDTALANGGRALDAFDTGRGERPGLPQMYGALGFEETGRESWNDAYAPEDWPSTLGKPDVVFMHYKVAPDEMQLGEPGATAEAYDPAQAAVEDMVGTSSSRQAYAGEPTRPTKGIGQPATPVEAEDLNLRRISDNFIRLLNLTARQGRLVGGQNVFGEYNRRQATVRLRSWGDLSTVVHEGGHAINDAMAKPLNDFVSRNAADITKIALKFYTADLSKAPAHTQLREGFAEFFRLYTLTPQFAKRQFPKLTADFEAVMQQHAPKILAGLGEIAAQYKAYNLLPSDAVLKNMVVDGRRDRGINAAVKELKDKGFKSWMQEHVRRMVMWSVNRYAPLIALRTELLNLAQTEHGKSLDLKRSEDFVTMSRLGRNSGSRAQVQLTDGVIGYRSTQSYTRGLREALMTSQGVDPNTTPGSLDEDRLHDFDAYLVGLRALDEYDRMDQGLIDRPPINMSRGDVTKAIQIYDKRYGPAFRDAAAIVHEYAMGLWQKQFDAGLMDQDTYNDGLTRKFYAPLQRDMSDKKATLGSSALTQGNIVKRFRGSDRDIVSPMATLMHKTFALEQIIAENDAKKYLALLADRVGRAGALVERIPASQIIGKQYSVAEVAHQLTADPSISAADAADLMTILQASMSQDATISMFRREQAPAKGENVMFFWEGGKLAALQLKDGELGADVINAMNAVGRETMDSLGAELLAGSSSLFRSAITAWPDFLIVNFIRDQLSAWILTDVGFKPFISGMRGVVDEIRQKQWAKNANASGMIMGGMAVASIHSTRVDHDLEGLRSKGYLVTAFHDRTPILGAIKGMAHVTGLTETGTRLGLYRHAFERGTAEGLNDYDASIEAAYIATDYVDFGLNGSRMLLARRTIPFLNAALQSFYKMGRTLGGDEVAQRRGLAFALSAYFKNINNMDLSRTEKQALNTGRKAWIKMASLGLISALLGQIFKDDPDYQETSEYLKTTGWTIPLRMLGGKPGDILYIPKPFELALMANAVERGIEFASGDPTAPGRFMRGAAMVLLPPTTPPLALEGFELASNYDFFSGRQITPDYMQGLEPSLRYDNYTSSVAKWIGQTLNVSPMVVDHIMSSMGASSYRDLSTMLNQVDPSKPDMDVTDVPILRRFVRDVRRGSVSGQDFWAQASQTNGRLFTVANTYKTYMDAGNAPAANQYLQGLSPDEHAYAVLSMMPTDDRRLNPFFRATQVTSVISSMRREMGSDIGLGDTTLADIGVKPQPGEVPPTIPLTKGLKEEVDDALSELARREIRNTLVATKQPGWADKQVLPTDPTLQMLRQISPDVADEYQRRMTKARVYDAQTVYDGWPDVRDRLIQDGPDAVLSDAVAVASAAAGVSK